MYLIFNVEQSTNGHSLLTIGNLYNGPNDYTVGGRDAATGGLPWPVASAMKYPAMAALVNTYAMYGTNVKTDDACYMQGVWLNRAEIPTTMPIT